MIMVFEISIYLLIALICGIALIVLALFGFGDFGDMDFDFDGGPDVDIDVGHFDAGHGDISGGLSPLSLPLVLSFGTSFGAFGVIFQSMGFSNVVTPILAGFVSLGIAALMFFILLKVFIQTQANTQVSYRALVGQEAVVTIPIKEGTAGQIRVITEERGRTLLSAQSEEEIAPDSIVTIEKFVGSIAVVNKK